MTQYTVRSMVIICPVDTIPAVDQMAAAIGYVPGFSVPLSPTGTGEPTHKALHATARRHFLWTVTGQPEELPVVGDEPTPLTEQALQDIVEAEAALVFPDPESDNYDAELVAYHDALTTIRAPLHAYSRAVSEYKAAQKNYTEVLADRTVYDNLMAGLLENADQATVDGIRAQLIVSADPVVDDNALYGRQHLDWVATANGLQLIEEEL